jgi:hypothetical protein
MKSRRYFTETVEETKEEKGNSNSSGMKFGRKGNGKVETWTRIYILKSTR